MTTSAAPQSELTPREIVRELDKYIIGQDAAKRSVAIALRNRWRRLQVAAGLREEIMPNNIILIGPTGVGKTEIARRLARLANAPFIKVEASKFTEVGYVGRDVESIIRDLTEYRRHHGEGRTARGGRTKRRRKWRRSGCSTSSFPRARPASPAEDDAGTRNGRRRTTTRRPARNSGSRLRAGETGQRGLIELDLPATGGTPSCRWSDR